VTARFNRATTALRLGEAEIARGGDAGPFLHQAAADADAVLQLRPNDGSAGQLRANVALFLAAAEAARGADASDLFRQAIDAFPAVRARRPGLVAALSSRAGALTQLAEIDLARGLDARPALVHALADLDAALAADPLDPPARFGRGNVHVLLAGCARAAGEDARPHLQHALADYEELLARMPSLVIARIKRSDTLVAVSQATAAAGGDARADLQRAMAESDEAVGTAPEMALAWFARAKAGRLLAHAAATSGEDPLPFARRAATDLETAADRSLPRNERFLVAILLAEIGDLAAPDQATRARDQIAKIVPERDAALAAAPPWSAELYQGNQALRRGDAATARTRLEQGLALFAGMVTERSADERDRIRAEPDVRRAIGAAQYNLGCLCARAAGEAGLDPAEAARRCDEAFPHLEAAVDSEYGTRAHYEADADLAGLRHDPRWPTLLARLPR